MLTGWGISMIDSGEIPRSLTARRREASEEHLHMPRPRKAWNIPQPVSTFVNRTAELATVRSTLTSPRNTKCSFLELHGCKFRLMGSAWAEAARQEAGAPGSGGHGPARAQRALPVWQRPQGEALLRGAARAVRGGAGQGVAASAGPLGRAGVG